MLAWTGSPDDHPDLSLAVVVTGVGDAAETALDIEVDLTTALDRSLFSVDFPIVQVETTAADTDLVLAMPLGGGALWDDPQHTLAELALDYPGEMSMQFSALYDAGPSGDLLFLGTRDSTGHHREFLVGPAPGSSTGEGVRWVVRQVPEDNLVARSYRSPYATVIGLGQGDWYDAAQRHRAWAQTQPWTQQGPMRDNPA